MGWQGPALVSEKASLLTGRGSGPLPWPWGHSLTTTPTFLTQRRTRTAAWCRVGEGVRAALSMANSDRSVFRDQQSGAWYVLLISRPWGRWAPQGLPRAHVALASLSLGDVPRTWESSPAGRRPRGRSKSPVYCEQSPPRVSWDSAGRLAAGKFSTRRLEAKCN